MNTQSHILMGALLFGRGAPSLAWAGALGGLLPDLPMFVIVGFLRLTGHSFEEIFGTLYWSHWWQVANAIGHSFLLWGALAVTGYCLQAAAGPLTAARAKYGLALGGAALLHSLIDFLVHRKDAHLHFWPIAEWRFVSPVSYWDTAHYGTEFSLFEAGLGLVMILLLFRQFKRRTVRAALAVLFALYAAVPAFFIYRLGGG